MKTKLNRKFNHAQIKYQIEQSVKHNNESMTRCSFNFECEALYPIDLNY